MRYLLLLPLLLLAPAQSIAEYQIIRAATCSTYALDQSDSVVSPRNSPDGVLVQSSTHYMEGYCHLDLPHNGCLKTVAIYGYDNALQAFSFSVYRAKYSAEVATQLALWSSANTAPPALGSTWTSPSIFETIDLNTYSYFVYFRGHPLTAPNGMRLWSIEASYTPNACP